MDIDFSFWLTLATLITGAVWVLDVWVLSKIPAYRKKAFSDQAKASEKRKQAAKKQEKTGPNRPFLVEYAISLFPVFLIVLVLRSFLIEPFQIPSASMVPTLEPGDFILVNKFSYGVRLPVIGTKIIDSGLPERGDVMVFIPPHDSRYFIKRVIGLPGDRVAYRNQVVIVNGKAAPVRFIRDSPGQLAEIYQEDIGAVTHSIKLDFRRRSLEGEWIVPENHYFVLGDNRNASEDSRYWGFVSENNVIGKAFAIWMHKDIGLHLPTFERNGIIE